MRASLEEDAVVSLPPAPPRYTLGYAEVAILPTGYTFFLYQSARCSSVASMARTLLLAPLIPSGLTESNVGVDCSKKVRAACRESVGGVGGNTGCEEY